MGGTRQYTGGRVVLDVDGHRVGFLQQVVGPDLQADVAVTTTADGMPDPSVTGTRWTAVRATVGLGLGAGLYGWVKRALEQGYATSSAALTSADFDYRDQSVLAFSDAYLTELTVPRLDGASKDAGYLDVAFQPGQVHWSTSGGAEVRREPGVKQKAWLCSNFRLELGTLPCSRVASVEPLSWRCTPTGVSDPNDPAPPAVLVTVPDLRLTVSMADHAAWAEAARRWFLDGQHQAADELDGRLVLLGPDLRLELGEITVHGVGFRRFSVRPEPSGERAARFSVELYVSRMGLRLAAYEP